MFLRKKYGRKKNEDNKIAYIPKSIVFYAK